MSKVSPLYQTYQTDPALEKNGVWLDYGLNSKGKETRILVARAGGANEQYEKRIEVLYKPYRRQIQNETIGRAKLLQLNRQAAAEWVVKGWEEMEDEACNDLSFTLENVLAQFEKLPDLYDDVMALANKMGAYRKHLQEEDAKNSSTS